MFQMELVSFDRLLTSTHLYRQFPAYVPDVTENLANVVHEKGLEGYGVERLFCFSIAAIHEKSLGLGERPLFGRKSGGEMILWVYAVVVYPRLQPLQSRSHAYWVDSVFSALSLYGKTLKAAGQMSEVFTFVEAMHLIAKVTLWEEWGKTRQQKIDKLNSEVPPKGLRAMSAPPRGGVDG